LAIAEDAPRGELISVLRDLASSPGTAVETLAEFSSWLTLGLINLINLLAPELVVLGDPLGSLPESVLDEVSRQVRRDSMVSRAVGGVTVVRSALGRDAQLIGAAEMAFAPILDDTLTSDR
jgi:predicted NBD/HSP70 family sugar kinase